MPARNWFDQKYRRLLFCRYTYDFLIGIIGRKADAQDVMRQLTDFLRDQLRLEASTEKSKVSKASDGAVFLGYSVCTVSGGRTIRKRLQGRYIRARVVNTSRIHLVVPHDRVVRFNRRKGYGDLSRLSAIHRRYLVDSSVLESYSPTTPRCAASPTITGSRTVQSESAQAALPMGNQPA